MRIAFIGLGNMGGGMAANQAKAGRQVAAFDLAAAALDRAKAAGCAPAGSVAEAVRDADAVVTMLPAGPHVRKVYAEEIFPAAPQGALLIDLGGGKTDYVVYAQAKIADAGVLAVGGDHVTNDVARAFRLSTTEAEALKLQHGDAMVSAAGRTRRLPLPAAAGEAPRTAKLSDLQTIVHTRSDQIREVHRFIDPTLRRVTQTLDDLALPRRLHELTAETWEQLNRLADEGGDTPEAHHALDQLRDAYVELYEGLARGSARLPTTRISVRQ